MGIGIISLDAFVRLRMRDFVDATEIDLLENYEFLDENCLGEGLGFSQWFRLARLPNDLWSLSLDLRTFPAVHQVFDILGLGALMRGAGRDQIGAIFGEDFTVKHWTENRRKYTFVVSNYFIDCTITDGEGLHYFIMRTRS